MPVVTSSTQKWIKKVQTGISCTNVDRKMKIKRKKYFEVNYYFMKLLSQNFEVLAQRGDVISKIGSKKVIKVELNSFLKVFNYQLESSLEISSVTTDHHKSTRKYLKENCPSIIHQFDVWHSSKKMKKRYAPKEKQKANRVSRVDEVHPKPLLVEQCNLSRKSCYYS